MSPISNQAIHEQISTETETDKAQLSELLHNCFQKTDQYWSSLGTAFSHIIIFVYVQLGDDPQHLLVTHLSRLLNLEKNDSVAGLLADFLFYHSNKPNAFQKDAACAMKIGQLQYKIEGLQTIDIPNYLAQIEEAKELTRQLDDEKYQNYTKPPQPDFKQASRALQSIQKDLAGLKKNLDQIEQSRKNATEPFADQCKALYESILENITALYQSDEHTKIAFQKRLSEFIQTAQTAWDARFPISEAERALLEKRLRSFDIFQRLKAMNQPEENKHA